MNDRYQLLAALKGTAIKCLIAFCWERRQLTVNELCMYVGHDDQTVRKAMLQLQLFGLAASVISREETWHLTDNGYQLPLPMAELAPPGEQQPPPGEKNFLLPTTTTTVCNPPSPDRDNVVVVSKAPPGENFSSPEGESALAALHRVGIMGKKALELSRLEWVTPEYVRAMHARWQAEGYSSRDTGLLIKYMADGDPAPAICEECDGVGGHHSTCQSFGDLDLLAELVATGEVKSIKKPSAALIQAMMKYNQRRLTIDY